jgi:hypothetical protein
MSGAERSGHYFIGWDVGGWNCDKNGKSRDAIVVLDTSLAIVGRPWRGNLRESINEAVTTTDWSRKLFSLCVADAPNETAQITLAIDTPLGFSEAFVGLVTGLKFTGPVERSNSNPYLFRQTERHLFQRGLTPLSAIKDMIGSQATKGMHVLAKFAPHAQSCGVWSDGESLTAIEAYPSACKNSETINSLRADYGPMDHEDKEDALTCALIAQLYATRRDLLAGPDNDVPASEGWIWVPKDSLRQVRQHSAMSGLL